MSAPLLEESMCLNEYFIMGVYAALKSILEQMYKPNPTCNVSYYFQPKCVTESNWKEETALAKKNKNRIKPWTFPNFS